MVEGQLFLNLPEEGQPNYMTVGVDGIAIAILLLISLHKTYLEVYFKRAMTPDAVWQFY